MCGIAGLLYARGGEGVDLALLRRMTDLLAHRGPDDAGVWADGHVGLGHRRLSIIDLSARAHQPMVNGDGTVWITYNGECYNHREFLDELEARGYAFRSTSDTETVLHLYEAYGPAFLEKIHGMYALAIWDARRQRLLLARDRVGIKPLFYYHDARHLAFASELKALLADPAIPADMNDVALGDFMHLMSIPDPESIVRGVRKLQAGHYVLVDEQGVTDHAYWDVPVEASPRGVDFAAACRELDELLERAVSSHLLSDVPVGAFLSGGVDSGSVVSVASRHATKPVTTFSSTFRGLSEFDESAYARQVADLCGTEHHEFDLTPDLIDVLPRIVWSADEPFAISSALPVYLLSRLARQHVKVVLTGDGADEIFGGYTWRHAESAAGAGRRWRRLLARLAGRTHQARPTRLSGRTGGNRSYVSLCCCYQDDELEHLLTAEAAERVRCAWADNVTQRYYDGVRASDTLTRKLYTDVKATLVSEMLTKVDRMTMAAGLEARVPFLDHRLVEWAFRLPSAHKVQGSEGKLIVKKTMERYLPKALLYRPKHGFNVPLGPWMRYELRQFVEDILAQSTIRKRGLFRPAAVATLLRAHFAGREDASNKIFVLLMLELWMQRFVDRRAEFFVSAP